MPASLNHSISLEPTPNIQPNLDATRDRQTGMPTLSIPGPIAAHVLPEHSVAHNGLENDAVSELRLAATRSRLLAASQRILGRAVDKVTPLGPPRALQTREMRAAARAVSVEVDHEAADAAGGARRGAPVVVVRVVAADAVALGPQLLDEDVGPPALEAACALFNALYRLPAWKGRFLRVPDLAV